MSFRIKNITKFDVSALGISLGPKEDVDLTDSFTDEQIRTSLLEGELYHKIQGRMLSVLSPPQDWGKVGLSEDELSRLAHAGFFQGFLGLEELKPPFHFDGYGNLATTAVVNLTGVTVNAEIRGDNPVVANRDNVLIAGTDTGAKGGTVLFAKIDGYNQIAVVDEALQADLAEINSKIIVGESDLDNSIAVNIVRDQLDGYVAEHIADQTNVPIGTYDYYIDMWGWRYVGLYISLGTFSTAKIYTSGEFDAAAASASYIDSTCYLFRIPTLGSSDNHLLNLDTVYPFRWIKVEVNVTAGTNSHGVWVQKMKAL